MNQNFNNILTREQNAGGRVTGTHFGLRALQRGEEGRENQRRLGKSESGGHVARHPEVRVLIDGAGNQATNILTSVENEGE